MSATAKRKPPLRDRIIPWYFMLGFMIVLAVNILFVRTALQSNSGIVTDHAYEKGLAYNAVLAQTRAEQAQGWKGTTAYQDGSLRFTVLDRDGNLISGAEVTAYIDRPLTEGLSQTITLQETSNGSYAAPLLLSKPGQWDVTVSMKWNKHYHQTRQRILAP